MRAVIQRVTSATVEVGDEVVGSIGPGLCVLIGVTHDDTAETAAKLANRLWNLRIFADDEGAMNRSVAETSQQLLIISQFTLYADVRKGRRPSFVDAAPRSVAEPLIEQVVAVLRQLGAVVETGQFGADMSVSLTNDGPVTVVMDQTVLSPSVTVTRIV
jgi:D-tyrosyl-tRNA(Tyr) deacylase